MEDGTMEEWGKPAKVNHINLDNLILNGIPEVNIKISAIVKFAGNARNIETFNQALPFVNACNDENADRSDIFYVIDHTNVSWGGKLLLKLALTFNYRGKEDKEEKAAEEQK